MPRASALAPQAISGVRSSSSFKNSSMSVFLFSIPLHIHTNYTSRRKSQAGQAMTLKQKLVSLLPHARQLSVHDRAIQLQLVLGGAHELGQPLTCHLSVG
jgi:hypothetical protein